VLETDERPGREWRTEGWTGEPTGPPRLDGGRLCLDFANTVGGRGTEQQSEFLTSYAVLVAWAWYAGAVDDVEADRLRQAAARQPAAAKAAHRRALSFRDAVYRLFVAVARREEPAPSDLETLTRLYQEAFAHSQLRFRGAGLGWDWIESTAALDRPLWMVAQSAVELLTGEDATRIKVCHGRDGASCWWVFCDDTKNRIRRWCSMAVCGSGAKAQRLTAKRRAMRHGSVSRGR
jgi:predicted RNA-binding Zn ribbon-like protein